ncbi:MAG: asparagine synthase (glutamine-hydrolyzing) [Bacteroidetes bacterium]|nr:asparagine synthase (glutamine-hydrolyzing) [Bacteroidota bacterium]
MCGITGLFAFNEVGRVNLINLVNATDSLESRGPDNRGFYNDYFVGLGHRRLSIIDISHEADQPMEDSSGRYLIVYNGEIYNFKELRTELRAKGVKFNSQSDTEVALYSYITWGENCLDRFNGFFAFAIYDREEEKIVVARDRIGIKPLLYYFDNHKFVFASEMKSLLAFGVERQLDYSSLAAYLQLNYIPAPNSIMQGIKKLMPGHFMVIKKNNLQIKKYYQIPYPPDNVTIPSYENAKQRLVDLLEESVKKRLVSDVPLGAFLSGGIDSSIIVALASRHKSNLNTFSIGYKDDPFFDETKYANLVAKHFNTEHTVFKLSNDDLYHHLFDILNYLDEPFADSSALPVYILSKHTRQTATVALSGDGADELFSGYNKHNAFLKSILGGRSNQFIASMEPLWKILPQSRGNFLLNKIRQAHRFSQGFKLSMPERYWKWAVFADKNQVKSMFCDKAREYLDQQQWDELKSQATQFLSESSEINDVLYSDMHLVLANDMLVKVDMMSMANSLEVRVPFLDHKLVEYAFQLPQQYKIDSHMRKRIVQDAFRDILPSQLYRRPKHGFEVPLLKWFRKDLRSLIQDDLLHKDFVIDQGIFDPDEIESLKKRLFSINPGDIHARIWGLIVFQWWWKKYLPVSEN